MNMTALHSGGLWRRVTHSSIWRAAARQRLSIQALLDIASWALAIYVAMLLRFEFDTAGFGSWSIVESIALLAGLQVAVGLSLGLYRGRWRFGSFEAVAGLAKTVVSVTAVFALANRVVFDPRLVPVSVSVAAGVFAMLLMARVRFVWRMLLDAKLKPNFDRSEPVIVFGAGEAGAQVIDAMLRTPDSPYRPVALLDDDPDKRRLRIRGVPVVGGSADLVDVARAHDTERLVVAVPSAGSTVLRRLSEAAFEANLSVRVLPPVVELFDGAVGLGDLRPLTEADLLGRGSIDTDVDSIAGYLTGKRVLVTGAGGSIGSELCMQIHRFAPEVLVRLDRDESALHALELRLRGRALLEDPATVVADIRDADRMREVLSQFRPHVVFHAAALKHLPLLEMHPSEALKTNVAGTQNVLDAAVASGVERFVNVSTDKAADPSSVLGHSKRVAERLTAACAGRDDVGTYMSVRFGNVLGSRGSVLGAFESQIAAGGPVTVTDADVTRYFMTVEEAVQLVIQAGAIGAEGDALVLDMGEPVRIADVARRLVAQAERPIEIVYTGLRPGEKLHEVLLGTSEINRRPSHPLISHAPVPPIDPRVVELAEFGASAQSYIAEFERLSHHGIDHPVGP